jgi:FkbM family methyltransferase
LRSIAQGRRLAEELAEIRPVDRPDLSFEPVDSMVVDALYWFGVQGYEGRMGAIWPALCAASPDTLEIGGNIGLYAVLGGSVAPGRYTVVEPLPELCALIRRNLERNQVAGVEVIEAAAIPDSERASVRLLVPAEGRAAPVGAHLAGRGEVHGRSTARGIDVPGHPIAALAAGRRLIKMDAEGIEADLISAARAALMQTRPIMVIEVLPEANRLVAVLREMAAAWNAPIHVVPEYGSDRAVRVDAASFDAATPARHRAKDIILGEVPAAVLGE